LRPYVGINNLFNESYNSNIRINAFGGRYFEPAPERNIYATKGSEPFYWTTFFGCKGL
jgi:hypothetical protein